MNPGATAFTKTLSGPNSIEAALVKPISAALVEVYAARDARLLMPKDVYKRQVQAGCIPVFVDSELTTYNADLSQFSRALSPKTKAVMIAHTLGNPYDPEAVRQFCREHGQMCIRDRCTTSQPSAMRPPAIAMSTFGCPFVNSCSSMSTCTTCASAVSYTHL